MFEALPGHFFELALELVLEAREDQLELVRVPLALPYVLREGGHRRVRPSLLRGPGALDECGCLVRGLRGGILEPCGAAVSGLVQRSDFLEQLLVLRFEPLAALAVVGL